MNDVTVCIPSIPPRATKLRRALQSVGEQTEPPDDVKVVIDHTHAGAADTRNRAWRKATTDWISFLDDDDEFLPHHLERLFAYQRETDADLVFPWFKTSKDFTDPLGHKGIMWNPEAPHMFPITIIVRRALLEEVGGFLDRGELADWEAAGEDWETWLALRDIGAKIVHLNQRTWLWNYDGTNTSGRGDRW